MDGSTVRRAACALSLLSVASLAMPARAISPLMQIDQIYTNASGSV